MDCTGIQELLITDYIDNGLENEQKTLITKHLAYCAACSRVLVHAQQTTGHFKKAAVLVPGPSLWLNIREAIEEKETSRGLLADFWERLKAAVHVPRPAFALATVVTMIFMVGTIGQMFINAPMVVQNSNGQDQVEYISSLINGPQDTLSSEPQTPIEKYFL